MTPARWAAACGLALLAVMLLPTDALAWSPGTHIYLGETVLANLAQVPLAVADLLRAYPYDFLYGSIAADTSIAKKYAPVGRHCHAWHVGQEVYDRADTEPLRAFGLGYLAHLAADSIAHNFFVPRQLVVTSTTVALGHSYWESRFELHLGEHYAKTAVEVIQQDHQASDGHLDRILSPTIFSVRTSRRLFRGMVGVTETQSWQRAFRAVMQRSRWDLPDEDVERQMGASFEMVMALLNAEDGLARRYDPAGESSLQLAKKMRMDVLRNRLPADRGQLAALAEERFGLPDLAGPYWDGSRSQRPWEQRNGT